MNWGYISQGFVNGIGSYSAIPFILSTIKRERVKTPIWKTAVAAGSFIGGYRFYSQLLERLNIENKKLKDFVSGASACTTALIIDDSFMGSFLIIWWMLKSFRCILPESNIVPIVCMSASSSVLVPASFLFRDEHQRQYQSFMEKMMLYQERVTLLKQDVPIMKKSMHGWDRWVLCDELQHKLGAHPNLSCTHSILTFIGPRIFLISLKMYIPMYLLWQIFKFRLPNKNMFENILRSTLFLTSYTLTQYFIAMWFTSTISPKITRLQYASFAWISGLLLLLERRERRAELTTYCAAHALNSLYLLSKKKGLITSRFSSISFISYLILILSSGIFTAYSKEHSDFIKKFFGFK